MSRIAINPALFGQTYDPQRMRELVAELERQFARVRVDTTNVLTQVPGGSAYAVTASDSFLEADTSAGNISIQLGTPTDALIEAKFEVSIKKAADENALFIDPTGGATIDYATDGYVLYNRGSSLTFRAVTGGWRII